MFCPQQGWVRQGQAEGGRGASRDARPPAGERRRGALTSVVGALVRSMEPDDGGLGNWAEARPLSAWGGFSR